MKRQYFCKPQSGKLVHHPHEGVTSSYNIHLGCSREHWNGITKENSSEKCLHPTFEYVEFQNFYEP